MRVEYNTTILDIVYDESGQPFSIRYKSNPTKEGVVYYYVLNAQGDVIGLLNASGELVVEYKYDPWGKLLETIIGVDETDSKYAAYNNMGLRNPLRYRGYIYDRDTGLYYLQSRYYDPAIGRFINADTYTTTDADGLLSTNMFAYCENNPVSRSDPNGEMFGALIGGALLGGVINVATTCLIAGLTGEDISVGTVAGAFVGGAIGGTLTFSYAGRAAAIVVNATAGAVGYITTQAIDGKEVTFGGAAKAALSGAVTGAISGGGIFRNKSVAEAADTYNSLVYNIRNQADAESFTTAAAGFQKAASSATSVAAGLSSFGSAVGNAINRFLNWLF